MSVACHGYTVCGGDVVACLPEVEGTLALRVLAAVCHFADRWPGRSRHEHV